MQHMFPIRAPMLAELNPDKNRKSWHDPSTLTQYLNRGQSSDVSLSFTRTPLPAKLAQQLAVRDARLLYEGANVLKRYLGKLKKNAWSLWVLRQIRKAKALKKLQRWFRKMNRKRVMRIALLVNAWSKEERIVYDQYKSGQILPTFYNGERLDKTEYDFIWNIFPGQVVIRSAKQVISKRLAYERFRGFRDAWREWYARRNSRTAVDKNDLEAEETLKTVLSHVKVPLPGGLVEAVHMGTVNQALAERNQATNRAKTVFSALDSAGSPSLSLWMDPKEVFLIDKKRKKTFAQIIEDHSSRLRTQSQIVIKISNSYVKQAKSNLQKPEESNISTTRGNRMLQRTIKAVGAAIFSQADENGDGVLDRNEITSLLKEMGLNPTEQDIDEVMDILDRNHDGFISKEEHKEFVQMQRRVSVVHAPPPRITSAAVKSPSVPPTPSSPPPMAFSPMPSGPARSMINNTRRGTLNSKLSSVYRKDNHQIVSVLI